MRRIVKDRPAVTGKLAVMLVSCCLALACLALMWPESDTVPSSGSSSSPAANSLQPSARPQEGSGSIGRSNLQASSPVPAEKKPDRVQPVPDWAAVAREYAAEVSAPHDPFHDLLLKFLTNAAAETATPPLSAVHGSSPDVDRIEADRSINPMGLKLDDDERVLLANVLAEQLQQVRLAERDLNLTHKMCTSKALLREDYLLFPAGTKDLLEAARAAVASRLQNPRDMNMVSLPLPDGRQRVVVLFPDTSPEHFQARRHREGLEAEHQVAIRSFFLPRRR